MPIYVYNTLTRKKEEFIPVNHPKVNIYTCGVTVYDESHIGHARSLYIFDVIRRYLKYRGFEVRFVRNITDIDDKIIKRAQELKVDWQKLVKKYIDRYYEDLEALAIEKADVEPRATENISDMIKHITGLIDRGYAYITNSGVYFNVRKFKDYGKLSGQSIDQMQSGVRIEPDETKKDPLDFALWKNSKEGEPSWDSLWGKGRPGWHIECSVMSQKFLNTETLDIHAGGRDLVFPHHENEIAQSEALTGKPFARYWLHHGLLTINGQKMAKSLGNFASIKDIISKYPADVLKLFFLEAHYSSPLDFSWEKLEGAKSAYERFIVLFNRINQELGKAKNKKVNIDKLDKNLNDFKENFIRAMDDDFNTPRALGALFDLISFCNRILDGTKKEKKVLIQLVSLIKELSNIFGLTFKKTNTRTSEKDIEKLIRKRNELRKNKDFQAADKIRQELKNQGIIIEDTKDRTIWRREI